MNSSESESAGSDGAGRLSFSLSTVFWLFVAVSTFFAGRLYESNIGKRETMMTPNQHWDAEFPLPVAICLPIDLDGDGKCDYAKLLFELIDDNGGDIDVIENENGVSATGDNRLKNGKNALLPSTRCLIVDDIDNPSLKDYHIFAEAKANKIPIMSADSFLKHLNVRIPAPNTGKN